MQPATYNFSYYKGDTFEITVNLYDANGQKLDVDAWNGATFGIAPNRGDYSSVIPMNASLNKTASTVTCSITAGAGANLSGAYHYDVTLYKVAGSLVSEEYTVMTGTITVLEDVVRSQDVPGVIP